MNTLYIYLIATLIIAYLLVVVWLVTAAFISLLYCILAAICTIIYDSDTCYNELGLNKYTSYSAGAVFWLVVLGLAIYIAYSSVSWLVSV